MTRSADGLLQQFANLRTPRSRESPAARSRHTLLGSEWGIPRGVPRLRARLWGLPSAVRRLRGSPWGPPTDLRRLRSPDSELPSHPRGALPRPWRLQTRGVRRRALLSEDPTGVRGPSSASGESPRFLPSVTASDLHRRPPCGILSSAYACLAHPFPAALHAIDGRGLGVSRAGVRASEIRDCLRAGALEKDHEPTAS